MRKEIKREKNNKKEESRHGVTDRYTSQKRGSRSVKIKTGEKRNRETNITTVQTAR
jgi:hypothetical protein